MDGGTVFYLKGIRSSQLPFSPHSMSAVCFSRCEWHTTEMLRPMCPPRGILDISFPILWRQATFRSCWALSLNGYQQNYWLFTTYPPLTSRSCMGRLNTRGEQHWKTFHFGFIASFLLLEEKRAGKRDQVCSNHSALIPWLRQALECTN